RRELARDQCPAGSEPGACPSDHARHRFERFLPTGGYRAAADPAAHRTEPCRGLRRLIAPLIDGMAFAERLRVPSGALAVAFEEKAGRKAGLAVVLVGEDPASQVYVRSKGKQTIACGMASFEHKLPADTSEAELLSLLERLNADPAVDGILVQLP